MGSVFTSFPNFTLIFFVPPLSQVHDFLVSVCVCERERERDRDRERQRQRDRERERDRQTDRR